MGCCDLDEGDEDGCCDCGWFDGCVVGCWVSMVVQEGIEVG